MADYSEPPRDLAREGAEDLKKALLDKLYERYGALLASAARTSSIARNVYQDKSEGLLEAIRIVEGK